MSRSARLRDRIKIAPDAHGIYASLSTDELIFFFAGVLAAVIIGIVTIQDGFGAIIAREADQ